MFAHGPSARWAGRSVAPEFWQASSEPNGIAQPPLDAAVAFYPLCRGLRPWRTNVPTLVLLAGLDDIAPPAYCTDLIGRSAGRVQVHTFPEARHSFDMSDLPPVAPSRAFARQTVGFHAEAARQAWSEVLEHFRVRLP
jgi:dienelactone hydrolase